MVFGIEHCKEIKKKAEQSISEQNKNIKELQDQITDLTTKINTIKNGEEYALNNEIINYFDEKIREWQKKEKEKKEKQ